MKMASRAHRWKGEWSLEVSFIKKLLTLPSADKNSLCIAYFGAVPD